MGATVSSSRLTSGKPRSYALAWARTMMSAVHSEARSKGRRTVRPTSLIRRRKRLRCTELCRYFGTIIPNLGMGATERRKMISKFPVRHRSPARSSSLISDERRMRDALLRRKDAFGRTAATASLLGPDRHRQTGPSAATASIQCLPTGLRRHPGAETVLVLPLAVAWLVGGLHDSCGFSGGSPDDGDRA